VTVDARHLVRWTDVGLELLTAARADINALNIFPVPDGDTGTNVLLTWQAASEALGELRGGGADGAAAPTPLAAAAAAWSRGALLGARGNSGVITAQLMRGIAEVLGSASSVDGGTVARALQQAVELGYAGVARPVEGTILTVAAAAARAASSSGSNDLAVVVSAATDAAADALAHTPDQLPILARAGVVDAGGQGWVLLLEALRAALDDPTPPLAPVLAAYGLAGTGTHPHVRSLPLRTGDDDADGAFEVMYLLEADDAVVPGVRAELDQIGASVVVVGGDGLWNVHVHTDDPGPAIEAGVAVGRVFRIRITPLTGRTGPTGASQELRLSSAAGPDLTSSRVVVAVASGPASGALFESVGAHVVVAGPGARPSPAELVAAAGQAAEVLLLPNDDDHLAGAETAADELRARAAQVAVLPTHADVQGLAALAVHDPTRPFTEDVVAMTSAAGATRHGAVTRAEREAITSAGICRPGQILGVVEGDIVVIGESPEHVACAVVDRMLAAGGELATLLLGDDPFPGAPAAEAVRRHLHRSRLDVEVVVYDGGQAHYPLLIGVE
jgi:hypothetical protein